MKRIDDPELKDLAETLPTIVLRSKAPATACEKVCWWIQQVEKVGYKKKPGVEVFPAKPFQFALYLAILT